ncbi:hypothetical protein D770_25795 [Flammeovirgaceae bacterium 311]|nr:hypothetical protein D770_25795 [Flammeovirgaceae bacterium 311]
MTKTSPDTTTTIIDIFAGELEQEAVTTRKMLERIPDDKFGWKPHEKSMTIKTLATHIAELPTWIGMTLNTDELDFSSNPYTPADVNTTAELLEYFEKCLADGRVQIALGRDEQLSEPWTLRNGDTIYITSPKLEVLRMTFNQIVHHRAQLGVYLRLLNIPIPGSYGPSADEM